MTLLTFANCGFRTQCAEEHAVRYVRGVVSRQAAPASVRYEIFWEAFGNESLVTGKFTTPHMPSMYDHVMVAQHQGMLTNAIGESRIRSITIGSGGGESQIDVTVRDITS